MRPEARAPAGSPGALPRASGILLFLLLLVGAALLFGLWPALDLIVSAWGREISGGSFQSPDGWWQWLYRGLRPLFYFISGAIALLGLASLLLRRPVLGVTPLVAIFILLAFALTQGLVVDAYLKIAFGRARPRDIVDFGGSLTFTPFYVVAGQCASNCSFVSGHAAMAFAVFAFAFVAPAQWRRRVFWFAFAFGAVTGYMRIIQGAHFFSDVVFAGLVVYGTTWLLALALLRPAGWPTWLQPRRRGRQQAEAA